jgi:hypothetical protein
MSICMKISPVRAELFHADGQTDVTMLIVALSNFANAPKNQVYQKCCSQNHLLRPTSLQLNCLLLRAKHKNAVACSNVTVHVV